MSKRPSTASAVLSRLRRPMGRMRDLPIWSKLGLIMMVPTLATIVVGTIGLVGHIQDANDADRARNLANLSQAGAAVVHGLQNERSAAVILLGAPNSSSVQAQLNAYRETHATVDSALRPYAQHVTAASDLPPNFDALLANIRTNTGELAAVRGQIADRKISLTEAADWYEALINDLLGIGESAAQLAGDSNLSDRMRAAAAVSRERSSSPWSASWCSRGSARTS